MRALAISLAFFVTAACGGGGGDDGRADGEDSTSTSGRSDAVRTREPLSFRPVGQVLPAADCKGPSSPDTVASSDGSGCFLLGAPTVIVTHYRPEARASAGSVPDSGAIDVTLAAGDLERFNGLASSCFERSTSCPTGQLAVVFADLVRAVPTVQEPEFSGSIALSGREGEMRDLLREMNK